tara:strand:- start:58 stop:396 length:339 start_codon:yes stop_codon:yes gene_type:complete
MSRCELLVYGNVGAFPIHDFTGEAFYALSIADQDYFLMMLDEPMWTLVVSLQNWVNHHPGEVEAMNNVSRLDISKGWALTGLAQSSHRERCCCFLHMALLQQESLRCAEKLD